MRKEDKSKISFCYPRGLRAFPQTYNKRVGVTWCVCVCVVLDDQANGGWFLFYWGLMLLWVMSGI